MSASRNSTLASLTESASAASTTPSPAAAPCATGCSGTASNALSSSPPGATHRNLHQCLFDAGLETVLVNPLRSRRFAEAVGVLAGNDRVDAAMLARFGLVDGLEGTPPRPRNLLLLGDLLALRRKLVEQLAAGAGSAAGAPSRAACCTWPPSPRSVARPAPRPATNACARGKPPEVALVAVMRRLAAPAPRGPSLAGRASRPRCGGGRVIAALPGAGIPLPQHFLTPRSLTPDTEAQGTTTAICTTASSTPTGRTLEC